MQLRIEINRLLPASFCNHTPQKRILSIRPVAFGEALPAGTRLTLFSEVIADLTGASPNVYLEVGYAWGRNRVTLLLVKKTDDLKFDVRGQRCIVYENIVELSKKLEADLEKLVKQDLPDR